LPHGIFSNKKIPIRVNFGRLATEEVGILNGHLVYFTDIWYIFGHTYIHVVYFSHFGMFCPEKSGNPERQLLTLLQNLSFTSFEQ
jgi:hypothetical protein